MGTRAALKGPPFAQFSRLVHGVRNINTLSSAQERYIEKGKERERERESHAASSMPSSSVNKHDVVRRADSSGRGNGDGREGCAFARKSFAVFLPRRAFPWDTRRATPRPAQILEFGVGAFSRMQPQTVTANCGSARAVVCASAYMHGNCNRACNCLGRGEIDRA